MLINKLTQSLIKNQYEVPLTETDLEYLEPQWETMPETLSAFIQVPGIPGQKNSQHQQLVLMEVEGTRSANIAARFGHAFPEARTLAKQITAREETSAPNSIVAELVLPPEKDSQDHFLAPARRSYEIPFLTQSAVPQDHRINPDDILVSLQNDNLRLRSRKLDKEIIPRLGAGANPSNPAHLSTPLYDFLTDFQQYRRPERLRFDWGILSGKYTFLPRLTYKNVIISPARWNISTEELEPLLSALDTAPGKNVDQQLMETITAWRKQYRLPSLVLLEETGEKQKNAAPPYS